MEEVYKRVNDKMIKLTQHDEQMLSNQDMYNFWASLCTEEAKINLAIRKHQTILDKIREQKEKIKDIAKDCEKRLPKSVPSEVKEDE